MVHFSFPLPPMTEPNVELDPVSYEHASSFRITHSSSLSTAIARSADELAHQNHARNIPVSLTLKESCIMRATWRRSVRNRLSLT